MVKYKHFQNYNNYYQKLFLQLIFATVSMVVGVLSLVGLFWVESRIASLESDQNSICSTVSLQQQEIQHKS